MRRESSLSAILTGLAFIGVGSGLTNISVPSRAQVLGFETTAIGILTALYYFGFALSCFLTPRLVKRVGHIRAFISAAALLSICTLSYATTESAFMWSIFRCLGGFCMASVYMITESWVNDAAEDAHRGRVITIYRIVDLSAIVIGQILIGWFDLGKSQVFLAANIMMTAGVIPLAITTSSGPAPIHSISLDWSKVFGVSRIACLASLCVGLATGAYFGLGPIYAKDMGLGPHAVGYFMGTPLLAAVGFQYIVGRMADLYDRERLIASIAFFATGAAVVLGSGMPSKLLVFTMACVWGGFSMPIYSLAIAIANDRGEADDFLDVSGGLLLIYSFGAVIGPAVASIIMRSFGSQTLFLYIAACQFILSAYAISRRTMSIEPVPAEGRGEFFDAPRTTPAIYELDPRNEEQAQG